MDEHQDHARISLDRLVETVISGEKSPTSAGLQHFLFQLDVSSLKLVDQFDWEGVGYDDWTIKTYAIHDSQGRTIYFAATFVGTEYVGYDTELFLSPDEVRRDHSRSGVIRS